MHIDKYEKQKRALLEAANSRKREDFAKEISTNKSQVNNWLNRDSAIPYEHALLVQATTGISVEYLVPNAVATNEYVRDLVTNSTNKFLEIPIRDITNIKPTSPPPPSQHILVTSRINSEFCLITGANKIKEYRDLGHSMVLAIVLDIKSIAAGIRTVTGILDLISISDQVAIANKIKDFLGTHQGQRRDLTSNGCKKVDIPEQLMSICSEVHGLTDAIAAKLAGFTGRDAYRRANTVVTLGIPELITAMNSKTVSLSKAAEVAKLPLEQQQTFLKNQISRHTLIGKGKWKQK